MIARKCTSSKVDRIMVNLSWMDSYSIAKASFLNEGIFDHYPGLLTVYPWQEERKRPFKYFIMRIRLSILVLESLMLGITIHGSKMFLVVQKLKQVKFELKDLNKIGFQDVQIVDIQALQRCSKLNLLFIRILGMLLLLMLN